MVGRSFGDGSTDENKAARRAKCALYRLAVLEIRERRELLGAHGQGYYGALTAFSLVGTAIAEALGGWDGALKALVCIMAVDYITGVVCALIWHKSPKSADGTFESKASIKGLFRKGAILLVVLVAYKVDLLAGTAGVTRTAVILFFCANDGMSIVENLGIMGVPMPPALKDAFAVLRQKSGDEESAADETE